MSHSWVVVVPVKAPARAKTRLIDFGNEQRSALARAFAQDVIVGLSRCAWVAHVIVITDDPGFGEVALAAGCEVISDPTDSLNDAISHAGMSAGPGPIAVVVSDIPCATPEAFADLFGECENGLFGEGLAAESSIGGTRSQGGNQAFLPDLTGQGTTFLAARSASQLRPLFGPDSAAAHRETGAIELIGDERLRLDVDTSDDLEKAMSLGVGGHTQAVTQGLAAARAAAQVEKSASAETASHVQVAARGHKK